MTILAGVRTRLGRLPGLPIVIGFPAIVLALPYIVAFGPGATIFLVLVGFLVAYCISCPAQGWETAQLAFAPVVTVNLGTEFGLPHWIGFLLIPISAALYLRWGDQPAQYEAGWS